MQLFTSIYVRFPMLSDLDLCFPVSNFVFSDLDLFTIVSISMFPFLFCRCVVFTLWVGDLGCFGIVLTKLFCYFWTEHTLWVGSLGCLVLFWQICFVIFERSNVGNARLCCYVWHSVLCLTFMFVVYVERDNGLRLCFGRCTDTNLPSSTVNTKNETCMFC